ncbi:TlpA family protein disulfide reductase [Streptococcus sp.]|uniref:TlpA family protein disulfide reductase n=1 Tax=Streptococcus sp. TaxID=1306 RepID=UPI00359F76DC
MKKATALTMAALTSLSLLAACSTASADKDKMSEAKTTTTEQKMDKSSATTVAETSKMMNEQKMETQKMNQGEMAPDFTLQGLDGKTYRLSDLKGKKVYLKFWASWCSICLSTLGDADQLASEVGEDVQVLSVVSPNQNGEKSEADFKSWYAGLDYKHLPVALDASGNLLKAYGVRSYPTSAFIGSDGVLVKTHVGFMSKEDIKTNLQNIK